MRTALERCFAQIRFARATELARSHRYLEAEGLLSGSGRESLDPNELDLLARISAKQRRYGRARTLWEAALKQSPGNTEYERAIECAKTAEHFQTKVRKWGMIALLVFSLAVLVIAVWNFFPRRSPTAASDGGQQPDVHSKATPPRSEPTQVPKPEPATPKPEPPPATPPVAPQPAPATPQPAPATLKPESQPAPATPKPEPPPATPPVPPPPAPATPQPVPATPKPEPTPPTPPVAAPPTPAIPPPAPATPKPEPLPATPPVTPPPAPAHPVPENQ